MQQILQIAASNALAAAVLAVVVSLVSLVCRKPALLHALWLIVLVKLLTPPIYNVPIQVVWSAVPFVNTSPASIEPPAVSSPSMPSQGTTKPGSVVKLDPEPVEVVQASIEHDDVPEPEAEAMRPPPPDQVAELAATSEPAPILVSSEPSDVQGLVIPSFRWQMLLIGAWAAGSLVWVIATLVRVLRFRRQLASAQAPSAATIEQVRELSARLGLRSPPDVWMLPGRISPILWALGTRPRLYLPSQLWHRLCERRRATLLIHELAHLRRADHWVRCLELVTCCIYWWNPVVWWAFRELREYEEQCCDAWVVWALPQGARDYASALVDTVDFLSETSNVLPVAASGIGHVHDLRRRITMIMRGTTPRSLSGAGFYAVLALAVLILPLVPSFAQQPPAVEKQIARDLDDEEEEQGGNQRPTPPARQEGNRQEQNDDGARRDVENLRRDIVKMQQQLNANMQNLRQAERRLADEQRQREQQRRVEQDRQNAQNTRRSSDQQEQSGRSNRANRSSDGGNAEQRLAQLEQKLDTVLEEIRSLRREIRRTPANRGGMSAAPGMGPMSGGMGGAGGMAPGMQGRPGQGGFGGGFGTGGGQGFGQGFPGQGGGQGFPSGPGGNPGQPGAGPGFPGSPDGNPGQPSGSPGFPGGNPPQPGGQIPPDRAPGFPVGPGGPPQSPPPAPRQATISGPDTALPAPRSEDSDPLLGTPALTPPDVVLPTATPLLPSAEVELPSPVTIPAPPVVSAPLKAPTAKTSPVKTSSAASVPANVPSSAPSPVKSPSTASQPAKASAATPAGR